MTTCHRVPSNRLYIFLLLSYICRSKERERRRVQEPGGKRVNREGMGKDETAKEEGPEIQSRRSRGKRKGDRERIKVAE